MSKNPYYEDIWKFIINDNRPHSFRGSMHWDIPDSKNSINIDFSEVAIYMEINNSLYGIEVDAIRIPRINLNPMNGQNKYVSLDDVYKEFIEFLSKWGAMS